MSSAYSPSDPQAQRWWSLSPKQSIRQQGLQRQYSPEKSSRSTGLSTIAVALGFKSKKIPVLAIQDPAFPSSRPSIVTKTVNRPPSKSVSSTRSRVDSFGPHTPLDPQKDNRQSLLTISDTDPFAVRAIPSVPHTPSDPNRLSAYSNSSAPDFTSKNADAILNRTSYGSSSSQSQSNTHGSELFPLSPTTPDFPRKLKTKRSVGTLNRKQSLMSGDQSLGSAWESLALENKSAPPQAASSTILAQDKNRFSQPDVAQTPRPPMRARGMTDSGIVPRPDFPPNNYTTQPASSLHTSLGPSPRVIIRQPSVSRIGLPPSAPPRQELPPPPPIPEHIIKDDDAELTPPVLPAGSASSSTLSFASSISSQKEILFNQSNSPRKNSKARLERSTSTGAGSVLEVSHPGLSASLPPHALKKALSHQSFVRGPPPSTSAGPVPLPEIPTPSKPPRKQRSFHHPKFPLPPMSPLRPSTAQPQSSVADLPAVEHRRSSAGGLSLTGRKRLFSGSNIRRPSTSQVALTEDDTQSIFSVRSVPDQSMGSSMAHPISPTPNSSFWDEAPSLEHSPRILTHEYTPQQIMTRFEMAKLEASVDETIPRIPERQRTFSALSPSTMSSVISDGDGTSSVNSALADANVAANKLIERSASLMQKGLSPPPRRSVRPSTSQASMTTPTIPERSSPISSPPSPSLTLTSLPPPPRRPRPRATLVEEDPVLPSLPPPPGRRFVRPKPSFEKILHRRSILRKPSFLEISDEESDDDRNTGSFSEPPSGSFLDLARESFDTSRSMRN
ncbi:hypothetical protein C0991_003256 [Blastosporella zonata]|nr:hypothetical protein C0991_003256 [Blastosporella zonata]